MWSTYREVMRLAVARSAGVMHGPAPLPFVAAEYSPAAIDSSRPLARQLSLQIEFPTWEPQLKKMVARLAVPLLVLPRWCVGAPWWLVFVAHEVGHRLTRQLELFAPLAQALDAAVTAATGCARAGAAWKKWTEEIVADAWSLALVGPGGVEALGEVELGSPLDVRTSTSEYPSPVLRLAVLCRLSTRLGLGAPALPPDLQLDAETTNTPSEARDAAIDAVAASLLGPLPRGLGTIETLAALDAKLLSGGVTYWKNNIGARPLAAAATLEAPRQVAAGTFRAWLDMGAAAADVEGHAALATQLADDALVILGAAGPPGERASQQPGGESVETARDLAELLLALSTNRAPDVATALGS